MRMRREVHSGGFCTSLLLCSQVFQSHPNDRKVAIAFLLISFLQLNEYNCSELYYDFISIKELGKYFGKLAISWLCALGAVAILNIKKEGFLVTWINWNVSLGEPFTPLISRNQFLLGILTVINSVGRIPLLYGVLHQGGALILLMILLFVNYQF